MADTLSNLSNEAEQYAAHEQWGAYRNVRYETAEYVRQQGNWKRAGYLYLEVLIFDLQGVSRPFGRDGTAVFNYAFRHPTPAVVREVARFSLKWNMDKSKLKAVYERVANQVWQEAFPRSETDVWQELSMVVNEERKVLQLEKTVANLAPDQLLSEEDAQLYIDVKNDYELIYRVERLLENENPPSMSTEKCNRAAMYLGATDIDRLPDRWKGKAYRRAGEIMLARGEQKKALEYVEQSLAVVDLDERVAVKQLVKALRHALHG